MAGTGWEAVGGREGLGEKEEACGVCCEGKQRGKETRQAPMGERMQANFTRSSCSGHQSSSRATLACIA